MAAVTTRRAAACPLCGRRATRIHNRYTRTLKDLPCCGDPVVIHLHTRRFVCRVRWCRRKIFTERIPALVAPSARRTARLRSHLQRVGFALGGAPGARHATDQDTAVSRRTLLRLIRAAPAPGIAPVTVLGVDDWAQRKGRTYGTILVNLETHTVIDLLPDRTAETFATWLSDHPETAIISRDRGGAYAEGARQGAPQAQQVADRFHLLKNLSEVVESVLRRQHAALRASAKAAADAAQERIAVATASSAPVSLAATPTPDAERTLTRGERDQQMRRAHRHARYVEVMALHAQGVSQREIARALRIGRRTIRQFVRMGSFPERAPAATRSTIVDRYEPYLRERWNAGCQNAEQLWREISAQGFAGSVSLVRCHLARWRAEPGKPGRIGKVPRTTHTVVPPARRVYSARQTAWLLLRDPADLDTDQQRYLEHLGDCCPESRRVQALARDFQSLIRTHDPAALASWLEVAQGCGIAELVGFAEGIRSDRTAVEAALTLPWSQGQTEGQVNRLKVVKRTMYGRAKFDLLRQRMLHVG
ncbi:MAG: ISL3 family transposase [Chloroflexota bacterium]|nr:ISL3 family transposase [Chloroflexota bacterium]